MLKCRHQTYIEREVEEEKKWIDRMWQRVMQGGGVGCGRGVCVTQDMTD